jgi:dihydrolipoamide dehydrogenase
VIGAGPGGYVAAIRAAQLGLKTAIVERQYMGGVCLNVGCIPTKALLHTADLLDEVREGKRFGVVAEQISLDWGAALKNKDQAVKQMTGGVGFLMKKNKIDVHNGTARLVDRGNVQVTDGEGKRTTLATKNVIIATGARARDLPRLGASFDEDRILSSTGGLALKEVPKSLLIIGASAIGCEFASMYRAFGSEVTLVEALPRIIPVEDEEISAELTRAFAKRGIKVMAGAKFTGVDRSETQIVATIIDSDGKEHKVQAERMLMGIGIAPNTQDLGLDAAGVELDQRGFVKVDGMQRTNVEGVYAIGDCAVTTPALAHKASAEGIVAAEHIAGHNPPAIDYAKVPSCTYCSPEIASIGLTEAKARERGYDVKVGKFPFSANGRARTSGETEGFAKVIRDAKYGEILGAHIIGAHATEMIHELAVARENEFTVEEVDLAVHAHPTLSEAVAEAVQDSMGRMIHA